MPAAPVRDLLDAAIAHMGGVRRAGQVEMAERVGRAFEEEKHLLVQAGTGTGKSLGYLAPSLGRGEPVVVATATLQLQHQLIDRELPALAEAVDDRLDEPVDYAVLKGRGNYACLHRIREGAPEDQQGLPDVDLGPLGRQVVTLREWAEECAGTEQTGDRDAAPEHTDRAWRQVSVSARECIGAERCPFSDECFAERAKERAAQADVVVTNHALLAIDAIEGIPLLPEHRLVVIDEAHELIGRITQASTRELSVGAVERVVRLTRLQVDEHVKADLDDVVDALGLALEDLPEGRVGPLPDDLRAALSALRDTARAALSQLTKADDGETADAARQGARAALLEVRQTAEKLLAEAVDTVIWSTGPSAGSQLRIAPLDVAAQLHDTLFAERTVVLTSATLKLGGDFAPMARTVGLAAEEWEALDVGTPFDYARQGILYVARHLDPPGRDGLAERHVEELCSLVEASGGGALGLFSSRRAAEYAADFVRERVGWPVWCQGEAHLADLTRRFVEDRSASLFGTLGLWQGLDVPGDTCRLVVIDRIPFPRPDDPVMSARARLIERQGGNGFMQVSATHAALLLAQGSGRLIRRSGDRGVVAVLDSRLATARYGSFLAASMPPLWRTTDPAAVTGALERLSGVSADPA